MRNFTKIVSAILALGSAAFATVSISSPTAGSSVGSPVHVVASSTSTKAIIASKIYVDSNLSYSVASGNVDTMLPMSAGSHYLVVQSWDAAGVIQKASRTITVGTVSSGSTGGGMTIPATAKVFTDIDQIAGWESCTICAGPGGNGVSVPYSMGQGVTSPAMDGSAVQFNISGTSPYGAALWWKQLGAVSTATNFVYDTYFYIKNPVAAQALEFDANQSVGGHKYIMGTQCNIKDHKAWDVFDAAKSTWVSTGIPCSPPTAFTWHHLVLEFQRTSGGQTKFVSITYDGTKSYVNRSYSPEGSGVNELNVAFQMDGDSKMTAYSVWLDKLKFSVW